jgi:hypothetical protein
MRALAAVIALMLCSSVAFGQSNSSAPGAGPSAAAAEKSVAKKGSAGKRQPSEKQLAQRARMKSCNADAKQQALKGDQRREFMRSCLKTR